MAEVVYVGRQRHPLRILLYQILTFGVYGRVYLYKILREFDGHLILFLDRRPFLVLLLLPILGPLFVKRKVVKLLEVMIQPDITADRLRPGRLLALGMIPLVPLFHIRVQGYLNHHWKMITKRDELRLLQEELERIRPRARSQEALERVKLLEKDVGRRGKELDNLEQAARALKEAEKLQQEAEREMRRRGLAQRRSLLGRLNPVAATKRLARRIPLPSRLNRAAPAAEASSDPVPTDARPPAEPRGKRGPAAASAETPAPDAAPAAAGWRGLFSRAARRKRPDAEAPTRNNESKANDAPKVSWRQRLQARRAKRQAAKEAKAAAKEARRREKADAKKARAEAKAAEKEKRKAQKAKQKEKGAAAKGASSPKAKKRKAKS